MDGRCMNCQNCVTCQIVGGMQGQNMPMGAPQGQLPIVHEKLSELTTWPTGRCTNRCDYCFVYKLYPDQPDSDMSDEVVNAYPSYCLKYLNPDGSIWFFGGEPMVAFPIMQRIYEGVHAVMPKVKFGLTTNATLIDREKAIWMGDRNFGALVSMDGPKHVHDIHRKNVDGEPTFEKTMEGLNNVRRYMIPNPQMRSTFAPDTVEYMYETYEFFTLQGLTNLAMECVYEVEWDHYSLTTLRLQLQKIGKLMCRQVNKGLPVAMKYMTDTIHALECKRVDYKFRCGFAQGSVGVDIDGKIYPCHRFVSSKDEKHVVGSIKDGILDNKKRVELSQEWIDQPIESEYGPDKCKACSFVNACLGGCTAVNYDMIGDFHKIPKSYCDIMQTVVEAFAPYALILRNANPPRFNNPHRLEGGIQ